MNRPEASRPTVKSIVDDSAVAVAAVAVAPGGRAGRFEALERWTRAKVDEHFHR